MTTGSARVEPTQRFERLRRLDDLGLQRAFELRGAVAEVGDGVARVVGLRDVGAEELVEFDSGALGMAYELEPERTGVVLLQRNGGVRANDGVHALGRLPSLPVSDALLGRVLDPLGRPLDERSDRPAITGRSQPIFCEAPDLTQRSPVNRPLLTGVMVIDAAIPIGRGQRQLIVGDRNVGKTALALDIIAAQKPGDVACVYVAVGQPMSRVLNIRETLRARGILDNTLIIAADAGEPPGLQYLAPYSGATAAEYFRSRGKDTLVVYDDLTKHADAYRELALLLGRPPGREAFPGDIFYIHAQLLERATALSSAAGGGSVTAFPIVETTDSDISAYIPTNLISITDGQVYLDSALFERNHRPAVDVGKSVSRVGGAAQSPTLHRVARNLRITLSQFEALESLTRVGLDVDPVTRKTVERGRVLRELLRQPRFNARPVAEQVLALTAVTDGALDARSPAEARALLERASLRMHSEHPEVTTAWNAEREPPSDWHETWSALLAQTAEQEVEP